MSSTTNHHPHVFLGSCIMKRSKRRAEKYRTKTVVFLEQMLERVFAKGIRELFSMLELTMGCGIKTAQRNIYVEPIKPSKLVAARSVSCNQEAKDIAYCTKVRNFFFWGEEIFI